jgi:endonuclease/exonuclease/phosphatase family metal-dependent hydrolase
MDGDMLNLLTLNTHKGFTVLNRRFVLHEIRERVRETGADIVFLQEVVGENSRHAAKHEKWPEDSHYEFLADGVWPDYAYGKNAVYADGHHGNAVLSRYPIEHHENFDISTNPFEQRGFLHCRIAVPDLPQRLHCICVHLGLLPRCRRKQLAMLEAHIERTVEPDAPLVIAGDFNDVSGRNIARLAKASALNDAVVQAQGRAIRTFPAWLPLLALDRIYLRGLSAISAEAHHSGAWTRLSDHAALSAQVRPV